MTAEPDPAAEPADAAAPSDEPPAPPTPAGHRPWVVLVGAPGAGKTTVGALLAATHRRPFRDTDADVEAAAGKPVADIFIDDGEAAFRRLEARAVSSALADHPGVLAVGGGALVSPDTRRLLAGHRVVFLDVQLSAAASRVGLGVTRPLLLGNVRGQLKALLDTRRPYYQEVATLIVPTDELTPEQVAEKVTEALGD